jgi:hypothetical protein
MDNSFDYYLKRLWQRRKYYLKLEWIHPFWLRAVISLVIAIPLFVMFVIGTTAVILLAPLIILVKFVGFSVGVIIWLALFMIAFAQFRRWARRHEKTRGRRPVRRP